jgi:hypothetical protein
MVTFKMIKIPTDRNFTATEIKYKLSLYEFRALANGEALKVIATSLNSAEQECWLRLIYDGHLKAFELDFGNRRVATDSSLFNIW